jgi:hypothetical protein
VVEAGMCFESHASRLVIWQIEGQSGNQGHPSKGNESIECFWMVLGSMETQD